MGSQSEESTEHANVWGCYSGSDPRAAERGAGGPICPWASRSDKASKLTIFNILTANKRCSEMDFKLI